MKLPEGKLNLLDRHPPIITQAPCLSGDAELLAIISEAKGKETFTVSDLRELAKDGGDLNKVFATYCPEELGLKFKSGRSKLRRIGDQVGGS